MNEPQNSMKPLEVDPEGAFRFYKQWLSERDHGTRGDILLALDYTQFLAAHGYGEELSAFHNEQKARWKEEADRSGQ